VVIEAIIEETEPKVALFRQLESLNSPQTIIE
jgi:3-hydroxyacyl-CoA dehydrogenase